LILRSTVSVNAHAKFMTRKVRYGLIGGGRGAFIGAVHRIAAAMDGRTELVCAALSSNPEVSRASAADIMLPASRAYGSFVEMMERERALPVDQRMDFVAIATPNHVHFSAAKAALEAGFHVLSDKPATLNLAEAKALREIVRKTGKLYGLTHNYTGYPLVKQAREMIRAGVLGKIRKVVVEYPQGWMATHLEAVGRMAWLSDPKKSGSGGVIGDIGTHAENLLEYVTGQRIVELAADATSYGQGRQMPDDVNVLVRLEGGAKGVLHASQISVGEENNLNIRVYGEKGGLEWHQREPNTLQVKHLDRPIELFRTGQGYLGAAAKRATRTPPAHPEGYLEAFANIYRNFGEHVLAVAEKSQPDPLALDYPGIDDAVRGMAFIEAVVKSSAANAAWTKLDA
jgi:predicted dehydrogenase